MYFGRESLGGLSISLLDVDAHVSDDMLGEIRGMSNVIEAKRLKLT
jgi:hypothetical protein